MKHTFIIRSEEVRLRVLVVIESLPMEPLHEIIIRPYHKDRSAAQNSTYWLWNTVIGSSLGVSKEDVAEQMKDRFLVQIYERDDPDYAEMIQSLRAVWQQGMKKEALDLRKRIVSLTSTTTATVPQMMEYMTEIENFATEMGIKLPIPDES